MATKPPTSISIGFSPRITTAFSHDSVAADGDAVFCSRRVALVAVVAERQVSAAEGTGPGGLQPGPQGGPRGLGVLARTSFNIDVYI